jgi:hypothetical protein
LILLETAFWSNPGAPISIGPRLKRYKTTTNESIEHVNKTINFKRLTSQLPYKNNNACSDIALLEKVKNSAPQEVIFPPGASIIQEGSGAPIKR